MKKSLNDPQYRAFIAHLHSARLEQGLSIRDLASLIDEPNSCVSKIENGERRLTIQEYVQYCKSLQIDPSVGIEILS